MILIRPGLGNWLNLREERLMVLWLTPQYASAPRTDRISGSGVERGCAGMAYLHRIVP